MTAIMNNTFDERIAATYSSVDKVKQAKAVLARKLGLKDSKIKIIEPTDAATGQKLEGNSRAIGANMLNLHVKYAAIGLGIGLLIALLLVLFGPTLTQSNPTFTFIALISPGIFIGTFYAGLRSLKPEHDIINQQTVAAKQNDYWTLLIDTDNLPVTKEAVCEEIERTDCVEVKES
ncbi:hypothetical protein ACOI22_12485 [Glaciecola sp. 2405UD65-10]|jgi:hypothetical protein|uniref:hypothetical protein n=1 Tax=Glaciecola sp. 2405UD65-10 TaxID=3397244 RepID=UPI003B5B2AC9